MTRLDDRYPDLLGAHPAPNIVGLVGDLDQALTEPIPWDKRQAIAATLHRQAQGHKGQAVLTRHSPRPRRLPPLSRPTTIFAAALLGLTVMAGGAYALAPLVDRAFMGPDGQRLDGQARSVHISQSACGVTMTVEKLYADAARVAIGYTSSGATPAGAMPDVSLTDDHGTALPAIGGGGTGDIDGAHGDYRSFDASAVAGSAPVLRLRLTAAWPEGANPGSGDAPTSCRQPLVFSLQAPVTPGRTVAVRQAVTAGGRTLTLERIVITPTFTTLYLRGEERPATAEMLIDGRTFHEHGGAYGAAASRHDFEPLLDRHGGWTIVVRPITTVPDPLTGGPWTFHVTVP